MIFIYGDLLLMAEMFNMKVTVCLKYTPTFLVFSVWTVVMMCFDFHSFSSNTSDHIGDVSLLIVMC